MISIDAIFFDLDGTLIDSKLDLALSVKHLQKEFGAAPSTIDEVGGFIGDGVVKLVQRALPGLTPTQLEHAVHAFKRYYKIHCLDHTQTYPLVYETLSRFQNKQLAVVTNKPVRISNHILEGLGLSARFQLVLGGDSFRRKKPDPEPIYFALRKLKVHDPRRALVVGDSPNDILAGRAAGTLTCGLRSNIGNFVTLKRLNPDFLLLNIAEMMRIFN